MYKQYILKFNYEKMTINFDSNHDKMYTYNVLI